MIGREHDGGIVLLELTAYESWLLAQMVADYVSAFKDIRPVAVLSFAACVRKQLDPLHEHTDL